MPRTIWNGAITFGMVSIPIGVYPAISEKSVSFHQLHEKTGTRIVMQKYCPSCKRAVTADEIVRGYEYAKDHYVVVTDEDLEKLPVPTKQTIEIISFITSDEIDPVYFDTTYYIEPGKGGRKPYAVLLGAMAGKKVVALAKIALRNKERLCVLRPEGRHLNVETLFYPDEVREAAELNEGDMKIGEKELKMAESLIEMLKEKFEPDQYHDTYREKLLELIEAKAEGRQVKTVAQPEAESNVIDLMDALKASVAAAQKRKSG